MNSRKATIYGHVTVTILRNLTAHDYYLSLVPRVLQTSLIRIQSYAAQQGYINRDVRTAVSGILTTYLNMWQLAKEQEKQRQQEEGSLYRFRTKTHAADLDDDVQNEKAFSEAFPNFDAEFSDVGSAEDLDNDNMGKKNEEQNIPDDVMSGAEKFIASVDVVELSRVHEQLVCHVLPCQVVAWAENKDCSTPRDSEYLQSFMIGYQAASVISKLCPCKN